MKSDEIKSIKRQMDELERARGMLSDIYFNHRNYSDNIQNELQAIDTELAKLYSRAKSEVIRQLTREALEIEDN